MGQVIRTNGKEQRVESMKMQWHDKEWKKSKHLSL